MLKHASFVPVMLLALSCASCQPCKDGTNGAPGSNGKPADESRVTSLENRVAALESLYTSLSSIVALQGTQVASIDAQLDSIDLIDAAFQSSINSLIGHVNALELSEVIQASELANLNADVLVLQSVADTQISELIDPCGPSGGYDEVLLKLGDGSIVAYFEQGSNRFLSVIVAGSYQTSDAQHCHFSVSASNVISY